MRHVLAGLLLTCSLVACSSPPATPKAAARAYVQALLDGDTLRARDLVVLPADAPEGVDRAAASGALFYKNIRRIAAAAEEKFGKEAAAEFGYEQRAAQMLQAVDAAEVQVNGDTAVLVAGNQPMKLKKVKNGWKVSLEEEQVTPDQVAQARAFADALQKSTDEVIAGIRAGKYANVREAEQAMAVALQQAAAAQRLH